MNSFFSKLALPAKLMLIAFLPLVFFIFLASEVYKEKTERINILEEYQKRIDRSSAISGLIDELQTERRYSFGYVIKKDNQNQLVLQRVKTDEAYNKLKDSTDEMLTGFDGYTMLNRLEDTRRMIDGNRISPEDLMNFYTNTIFRLNNLNNVSAGNIIYLRPVSRELAGQKLLSELITYLGILRANIYYDLYKKVPPAQIITQLHNIYDIYNSFQTEFLIKSSTKSIFNYNKIRNRGDLKTTIQYLDNLFYKGNIDNTLNAETWWTISANGVDELKKLQRNLLRQVDDSVNIIYTNEKNDKRDTLIFIVIGLITVVIIVTYTITVINKMLTEVNVAAEKISEGKTGVSFTIKSRDVIGKVAESILKIDANNKVLADAADAIGQGNFNVVITPRSEEDILSNSIKRMTLALRGFNKENQDKIWIHTGVEAVNDSIAGEKDVCLVAKDALNALVGYLGCEVGLFYSLENNVLEYKAGYAVPDVNTVPAKIKLGETLVGQAALKNETLYLQDLPDEYMVIKSATGSAKPKHVLIIPLVREKVLEGVIEIGSLSAFSDTALAMVEQVKSNITVALITAKNRARLQELLDRTKSQAEELRVQHSELENMNTELEAQAQKLQASEEELRVQQEELMQTNQELEERTKIVEERNQLIVERNIEIQQKARELELSTRYKSEFLANMSHELRTPLNSILLLSRLLAENTQKNLSGEQVEYAQVIQSSGNGLLALIDEILDLSKIEAGKMELEFDKVDITTITNDLQSLFSPIAKEKKLDFSISIDEDVSPSIETDKMRLGQVLKNLISNALKFTSNGCVKVHVSNASENSSFIAFSVKDTGIGIVKEKQQMIFEAFQQEDGSTRRKFGGTGLGLSISRQLSKLLGGEISVTSEPGKGSEFIVHIPKTRSVEKNKEKPSVFDDIALEIPVKETGENRSPENSEPKTPLISPVVQDDRNSVSANDKTILIVEDDIAFAKALLDYTRSKGYKAVVAVRGDEGIDLAREYNPTGILLDIQLPVKDGWEVMEELKSNPFTRHIPVHMMSANSARKESLQKGAIDFINKPVAVEQLQQVFKKIEQVVSRRGKKVLIVEENPKHAQALAYFLQTFNIKPEISNNINTGITALKREDVECVILDMGIPDTNAYETLETIRKDNELENLPIIIFTGKNLSKGEEQKIKQYADSIVIKTAFSYQRILDEVSLFLHLVEENKQNEKQPAKYKNSGILIEVLSDKTILIVDDDVRNIFSLTKVLEQNNMKVLSAMDGEEALTRLEENTDVDIVLMDVMMPVMDGYEATKKIRENFKYKDLPIIAVTAKAMTGDREKCVEAGASDYISKPVDIDQLLSLLRVWLYE
ncbi:response regulator [Segetibacter koreensis]|uniref:response regulator n=1 Tax=Segetibacter koreensis TaxID=398037 RepID=UPI000362B373|nr:response regulator [Segetibacter koreensis]